jgi:hypothetical protein
VVELALRSVVKEPFDFEEFDVGVDLSKASMIDFEGTDFAAYLCKSRASIADVETINIAKKKSGVGIVTRLNWVTNGEGGRNR